MTRLIGISFCILMCSLVIKEQNRTFSVLLSVAGSVLAFLTVGRELKGIFDTIISINNDLPSALSYVRLMLKVLCVLFVSQLLCEVCRDNGENALASFVEISAKVLTLSLIMPLFESVINIVIGLVK